MGKRPRSIPLGVHGYKDRLCSKKDGLIEENIIKETTSK